MPRLDKIAVIILGLVVLNMFIGIILEQYNKLDCRQISMQQNIIGIQEICR
jgi:hypothetical protein